MICEDIENTYAQYYDVRKPVDDYKGYKPLVILFSNTVVEPFTMMVEVVNSSIALAAVLTRSARVSLAVDSVSFSFRVMNVLVPSSEDFLAFGYNFVSRVNTCGN